MSPFWALCITLVLSLGGWRKKSLSTSGAVAATAVGFFTCLAGFVHFAVLLTFFLTSSILTKWKQGVKRKLEAEFKEGGQRNWVQVLANGLPGTLSAIGAITLELLGIEDRISNFSNSASHDHFFQTLLLAAFLGHYCACNGDTWASEVGILSKEPPILITQPWRIVPKGTNGGISRLGTLSSACGGFVIGISFVIANELLSLTQQGTLSGAWRVHFVVIALAGLIGFFGSFVDSFLGATLQLSLWDHTAQRVVYSFPPNFSRQRFQIITGSDLLNNDMVNLVAAFISSLSGAVLAYLFFGLSKSNNYGN